MPQRFKTRSRESREKMILMECTQNHLPAGVNTYWYRVLRIIIKVVSLVNIPLITEKKRSIIGKKTAIWRQSI